MKYCVDIREKESNNTITTILETESHEEAWEMVNKYNKCYSEGKKLRKEYPIEKYFIDVYNEE